MDQFCLLDILSSVTFVSPKGLTFDQTVRTWSSISRLSSANICDLFWHILHFLYILHILHILNNILHILHRTWFGMSKFSRANIHDDIFCIFCIFWIIFCIFCIGHGMAYQDSAARIYMVFSGIIWLLVLPPWWVGVSRQSIIKIKIKIISSPGCFFYCSSPFSVPK